MSLSAAIGFAKGGGAHAVALKEFAGEVIRIVKAYLGGDLGDAFVSGAQQRTGRFQPTIGQIVHEGHTGLPFEFSS